MVAGAELGLTEEPALMLKHLSKAEKVTPLKEKPEVVKT